MFQAKDGQSLHCHAATPIRRHIKVKGQRSPYDGDWLYWATRGRCYPNLAPLKAFLLKQQRGKCHYCGLNFMLEELIETHHLDGNHNNQRRANLVVMHRHCHNQVHAASWRSQRRGILDTEPGWRGAGCLERVRRGAH